MTKFLNTLGVIIMLLSIAGLVAGGIWYGIYNLMNPDMTDMRLFLSNPYPTIMAFGSLITAYIGYYLYGVE